LSQKIEEMEENPQSMWFATEIEHGISKIRSKKVT